MGNFVSSDTSELSNFYNKTQSDTRFQPKGNYQTAGNYALVGDAYTKSESDTLFQPKGNYQTAGNYALVGDAYTKSESDTLFQPKGNYQPIGNYALVGDAYTKSESDTRFQPKGNYALVGDAYTKSESDTRFRNVTNKVFSKNNTYQDPAVQIGADNVARDTNIYSLSFGQAEGGTYMGMGRVPNDKKMFPNTTGPVLGTHITDNDEWGLFSDGWKKLFAVQGGTGNVRSRGDISSGGDLLLGVNTASNAWIVHATNDDRGFLAVAPINNGSPQWQLATQLYKSGNMNIQGDLTANNIRANNTYNKSEVYNKTESDQKFETINRVNSLVNSGTLNDIRTRSMWCADGGFCEIPNSNSGIRIPDNKTITTPGTLHMSNNNFNVNTNQMTIRQILNSGGNLVVQGTLQTPSTFTTSLRAVTISGSESSDNPNSGRLHLWGNDALYVLNKNGMIVGKEWGGNGNLQVQGQISGSLNGDSSSVNVGWGGVHVGYYNNTGNHDTNTRNSLTRDGLVLNRGPITLSNGWSIDPQPTHLIFRHNGQEKLKIRTDGALSSMHSNGTREIRIGW